MWHFRKYITAKLKHYRRLSIIEDLLVEAEPLLWREWVQSGHRADISHRNIFTARYKACRRQMMRAIIQWISLHDCDDTLCESYTEKIQEIMVLFLKNGTVTTAEVNEILQQKPHIRLDPRYKNRSWNKLGEELQKKSTKTQEWR